MRTLILMIIIRIKESRQTTQQVSRWEFGHMPSAGMIRGARSAFAAGPRADMKTTHRFVLTDDYIANAQRVGISQNRALKFLYQTWWTWWLPRVFMVPSMIVLYLMNLGFPAALFGVMLVLSFAGEWVGRRGLARARNRIRGKGTAVSVSMDQQEIAIENENGNSHLKWSAMLQPAIYADGVLIKLSPVAMVWLPDQALIEGSPDDVRKLLAENVRDSSAVLNK
jgi:hypothetical protein